MALIAYSTGDQNNPGFLERVKQIVFPDLEPENLSTVHNSYIQNALILLQKHVPCLRSNNVNFYDKDDVIISCDTAYFNGPANARIQAIYAWNPTELCVRYHYAQSVSAAIMCHAEAWADCHTQDACHQNLSGDDFCDLETDDEATVFEADFKCASDKIFAHTADDVIYIAPRFPCDWALAVHWQGLKRHYENVDLLPDDDDLIDAAALYVQAERALRNDRDMPLHKELFELPMPGKQGGRFWQAVQHLQHLCREKVKLRKTINCAEGGGTGNFDAGLIEFDDSALSGFVPMPPQRCTTPTGTLTVNDQSITEGESVTLSYETENVMDCDESSVVLLANGVVINTLTINTSGTVIVSPTVDTTYTLRITSPCNPNVGPGTGNPTTPPTPIVVETTTTVDVDPVSPPPEDDECEATALVTAQTLGESYQLTAEQVTGPLGFYFTVGASDLVVGQLGRWIRSGNSQTHEISIHSITDGLVASATVNASGAPADAYLYANLTTPVVLASGRQYYLFSEEKTLGDTFFGFATPNTITTTSVVDVDGWSDGDEAGSTPNESISLPNLKYCTTGVGGVPEPLEAGQRLINIDLNTTGTTDELGAAAIGDGGENHWQAYQVALTSEAERSNMDLLYSDETEVFGDIAGRSQLSVYHPGIATGMFSGGAATGHPDEMMASAVVVSSFPAERQLRLVNMPSGTYDIIVYGPGAQMKVRCGVGGGSLSSYKTGIASENFDGDFAKEINYVLFTGIVLTDSTINIIIDIAASATGTSKLSGFQVIKRA